MKEKNCSRKKAEKITDVTKKKKKRKIFFDMSTEGPVMEIQCCNSQILQQLKAKFEEIS